MSTTDSGTGNLSANVSSDYKSLGILGGTFDPVHLGHLQMAAEAKEKLTLDRIKLIPSFYSYHRQDPGIDADHRAAMLALALQGVDGLEIDRVELDRKGHSYTIDTLYYFRDALGSDIPIVLLLGEDAFASFHQWHEWEKIIGLAHLGIIKRSGFDFDHVPVLSEFLAGYLVDDIRELRQAAAGKIAYLNLTPVDISASMVRERIKQGLCIDNLVPSAVMKYIETNKLYQ